MAALEADGRMTAAGRRAVDEAKSNGMWTVLDGAERLIVPDDLAAALAARPGAREAWEAMTAGTRRAELTTLALAKRADTRERHVRRIVGTLVGG
ncbi:MAG TPA: YdeI/OmpD-associated family protein [Humibacter sp.]|nr:YdeI/OmpD-associated family protein [Humibacter sp.]